ncbi:hypothetical protein [Methylobacterium sp. WL103]|nr:hypothetical protein [Methylobacterium sp. WL103]
MADRAGHEGGGDRGGAEALQSSAGGNPCRLYAVDDAYAAE